MDEDLISFKTAELAKEKGFAEEVVDRFSKSHNKPLETGYAFGRVKHDWNTHNGGYRWYSRPSQSILQKWIHERYPEFSLHCIPNETDNYGWHYTFYDYITDRPQNYNDRWIVSHYFDSYEDALECGLFKVLKLIK